MNIKRTLKLLNSRTGSCRPTSTLQPNCRP